MFRINFNEVFTILERAENFAKLANAKLKDLAFKAYLTIGFNFNRTLKGKILTRTKMGDLEEVINVFAVYHEGRRWVHIFSPNTDEKNEYDPCTCDDYYDTVMECTPLIIGYRQIENIYRPKHLKGEWFHFTAELEDGTIVLPRKLVFRPRYPPGHRETVSAILARTHNIPEKKLKTLHYIETESKKFKFAGVQKKSLFETPYGCGTQSLYTYQVGLEEWVENPCEKAPLDEIRRKA
jgi:hypothetical protein